MSVVLVDIKGIFFFLQKYIDASKLARAIILSVCLTDTTMSEAFVTSDICYDTGFFKRM